MAKAQATPSPIPELAPVTSVLWPASGRCPIIARDPPSSPQAPRARRSRRKARSRAVSSSGMVTWVASRVRSRVFR